MKTVKCEQCGKLFETYECYIKRGGGRFCSPSCSTRHRNLHNNPSWNEEVRAKISQNHADVSGENNPMFGKKGQLAPAYIHGRSALESNTVYGKILLENGVEKKCAICGIRTNIEVHHLDGDHENNELSNLVFLCRKHHKNTAHTYIKDSRGKYEKVLTNDITKFL